VPRAVGRRREKLGELLPILRCPASGAELVPGDREDLETADGTHRYRVIEGIPILVVGERSLFSAEAEPRGTDGGPDRRRLRLRLEAAARAVGRRLVPPISRNVKADENFARLARLLTDGLHTPSRRRRVLVVGGAVPGAGISQLLDHPQIEAIETDVVLGPRTQLVCDAHDLPFKDGSFDAVVCQGVLGNVADPTRAVSEIHRVLASDGLVYAETNFLQGVCMGPYDFTRFTHVGHRRLFRSFTELDSGVQCGPGMALAWSVVWFAMALAGGSRAGRAAARGIVPFFVSWLTLLDPYLVDRPAAFDAASATYFLGRRRETAVPDEEIVMGYRGAIGTTWLRERKPPRRTG
jgi:SAM-dependent methyltransferase